MTTSYIWVSVFKVMSFDVFVFLPRAYLIVFSNSIPGQYYKNALQNTALVLFLKYIALTEMFWL